jgi:hypothetical protein
MNESGDGKDEREGWEKILTAVVFMFGMVVTAE